MSEVFPLGPVEEDVESWRHYGKDEELPAFHYTYPGGAWERFEDYGDSFGVQWSPNPSLSWEDYAGLVRSIPQIENSPLGYDVISRGATDEIIRNTNNIEAVGDMFEKVDSKGGAIYVLDSGMGSFYWELDSRGNTVCVGVHTYNGAPVESVVAWQNMTADPEISQRGVGAIEARVPLGAGA